MLCLALLALGLGSALSIPFPVPSKFPPMEITKEKMVNTHGDDLYFFTLARQLNLLEQEVAVQDKFLGDRYAEYALQKGVVDGGWSAFTAWTPCTKPCAGKMFRFRHCGNPIPANGGRNCLGEDFEMRPCNNTCTMKNKYVRLVNGSRPSLGRLEIFEKDQWSTICDRKFSVYDAMVVCKNLGYTYTPVILGGAYFGNFSDSTPFLKYDLQCTGQEKDLLHCRGASMPVPAMACPREAYVNIDCEPFKPKLIKKEYEREMNATKYRLFPDAQSVEGRLEILGNDTTWGTVCKHQFSVKDAIVACRSLNKLGGFQPVVVPTPAAPLPAGPVLLDDVRCTGLERRLADCPALPLGHHSCHHAEDVSVNCRPELNKTENTPECPANFKYSDTTGFCYFFSEEKLPKIKAAIECQRMDAHLLEIRTEKQNVNLESLMQTEAAEFLWIGVTRDHVTGRYEYDSDGQLPAYSNFPVGPAVHVDCAVVTATGAWLTEDCGFESRFICATYGEYVLPRAGYRHGIPHRHTYRY